MLALSNAEQEFKREDVRVSLVTLVVNHALDHRLKHDLVVLQSVSFHCTESVLMSASLVILQFLNIEFCTIQARPNIH